VLGLVGVALGASRLASAAAPRVLVSGRGLSGLIQDRDHLYYNEGDALYRLDKAGGARRKLSAGRSAWAVVRDLLVFRAHVGDEASIGVLPLHGGAARTLVSGRRGMITTLGTDASGVYFAQITESALHLLFHVPLHGGPVREVAESPEEVGELVPFGAELYWTCPAGVLAAPKAGGTPRSLGDDDWVVDGSFGLAVDERFVYWSNHEEGRLRRVPRRGGRTTELARTGSPDLLVVDGGFVYFTDNDVRKQAGAIRRVPREGGAVELVVARRRRTIEDFLVDGGTVYWLEEGDRYRQTATGEGAILRLSP
jgi:hypothetical protein